MHDKLVRSSEFGHSDDFADPSAPTTTVHMLPPHATVAPGIFTFFSSFLFSTFAALISAFFAITHLPVPQCLVCFPEPRTRPRPASPPSTIHQRRAAKRSSSSKHSSLASSLSALDFGGSGARPLVARRVSTPKLALRPGDPLYHELENVVELQEEDAVPASEAGDHETGDDVMTVGTPTPTRPATGRDHPQRANSWDEPGSLTPDGSDDSDGPSEVDTVGDAHEVLQQQHTSPKRFWRRSVPKQRDASFESVEGGIVDWTTYPTNSSPSSSISSASKTSSLRKLCPKGSLRGRKTKSRSPSPSPSRTRTTTTPTPAIRPPLITIASDPHPYIPSFVDEPETYSNSPPNSRRPSFSRSSTDTVSTQSSTTSSSSGSSTLINTTSTSKPSFFTRAFRARSISPSSTSPRTRSPLSSPSHSPPSSPRILPESMSLDAQVQTVLLDPSGNSGLVLDDVLFRR